MILEPIKNILKTCHQIYSLVLYYCCQHITIPISYYISSRLVALPKLIYASIQVSNILVLTSCQNSSAKNWYNGVLEEQSTSL